MARAVLLALGVICVIYGSHAIDIENLAQASKSPGLTVASTSVVWQGDSCSGSVAKIYTGPHLGCYHESGLKTSVSCNNSTGRLTVHYSSNQCYGEWYMAYASSVHTCWFSTSGPISQYWGLVEHPPAVSTKRVPKPILGAGDIQDRTFKCNYRAGECPTDMTVLLWYAEPRLHWPPHRGGPILRSHHGPMLSRS